MFTDKDYEQYFGQIARIERKMIYGAYDLGCEINDPSVTRVLEKIGDDEVRHYGFVLKMFRMALGPKGIENRRDEREYYLGTISMQGLQEPKQEDASAYCVNISKTGICLEGVRGFSPGGRWDLQIRLFGKNEMISRRGKVVWSKEVEKGFSISGIQFEV